ncbi:MAG: hypothetical protein JW839_21350 [Candidatus Lokiarchaeota archaeon]|nr:hypothetical protein [Candidatus Lokiarchaeota archaeon]
MKCERCGKNTDITCARCGKGACASHSRIYRRRFFCGLCFEIERRNGLVLIWALFGGFSFFAMLAILLLR